MRTNRWVLMALVLMALVAAEAAAAQEAGRQRAPGVPLAPKPAEVYEDLAKEDRPAGADRPARPLDAPQERRAERGAERDIPMPKPVPSIIGR